MAPTSSASAPLTAPDAPSRKTTALVAVVFLAIAIAYAVSISSVWRVHGDGAVYLGLGRSLATGHGYTFNHTTYGKYPPVYPLLLSLVFATAGMHIAAMQAIGALCGLGASLAVYALVVPRSGRRPALAVAVLTATCTWVWVYSCVHILPTVPFTCASLAALWYAERQTRAPRLRYGRWLVATALVGVAIYTHLCGVALVPAVAAGALFARGRTWPWRDRLLAAAIVVLVGGAVTGYWLSRARYAGKALAAHSPHARKADDAPYQFSGYTYRGLLRGESRRTMANPMYKLRLRVREWAATPLSLPYGDVSFAWGLVVLGLLLVPGLVWGFRRFCGAAEFYTCALFGVLYFHGGTGGYERYAVRAVPLLLYFGALSLRALGVVGGKVLGVSRGPWRRLWLPRLGRGVLVLAFVALLGNSVYSRIRCRNGAGGFGKKDRARREKELRVWTLAAEWVEELVPEGAKLYTGGGGDWATIHLLTGRYVGKRSSIASDRQILAGMLAWGADHVLADRRSGKTRGLFALIESHPECFEKLRAWGGTWLLRIRREPLEQVLETMRRADTPKT